jgi:hypothetical protein
MALWEYKVITSGKGGFASATMLESFLNQLGKDEWEIIDFRTDPNNSLVFHGLARRPTQREWTLEAAVAAAAKAEADKLRAELMQKQHAGDASASADGPAGSSAGDKAGGPDSLRQLRDTDRDGDPEALAEEASQGEKPERGRPIRRAQLSGEALGPTRDRFARRAGRMRFCHSGERDGRACISRIRG